MRVEAGPRVGYDPSRSMRRRHSPVPRLPWLAFGLAGLAPSPAGARPARGGGPPPPAAGTPAPPPPAAVTPPVVKKNEGVVYPKQALDEGFSSPAEVQLVLE